MSAVEKMFADAAAHGELEERPMPGPPVTYPPLQRPTFPAPQWREAWLDHIALTPDPAYVDARVLAVHD